MCWLSGGAARCLSGEHPIFFPHCRLPTPHVSWDPRAPQMPTEPASIRLAQASICRAAHQASTARLGGAGPHSLEACLLLRGFLRPGPQNQLQLHHRGSGQRWWNGPHPGSDTKVLVVVPSLLPRMPVWLGGREQEGLAQGAPRQQRARRPVWPGPAGFQHLLRQRNPPPRELLLATCCVRSGALSSPDPRGSLTLPPLRRVTPGAPSCARSRAPGCWRASSAGARAVRSVTGPGSTSAWPPTAPG